MSLSKKQKRIIIWGKCGGTCKYCGEFLPLGNKNNITLDHIVPKTNGGGNKFRNLTLSCFFCNQLKENRSIEEYRIFILLSFLLIYPYYYEGE